MNPAHTPRGASWLHLPFEIRNIIIRHLLDTIILRRQDFKARRPPSGLLHFETFMALGKAGHGVRRDVVAILDREIQNCDAALQRISLAEEWEDLFCTYRSWAQKTVDKAGQDADADRLDEAEVETEHRVLSIKELREIARKKKGVAPEMVPVLQNTVRVYQREMRGMGSGMRRKEVECRRNQLDKLFFFVS